MIFVAVDYLLELPSGLDVDQDGVPDGQDSGGYEVALRVIVLPASPMATWTVSAKPGVPVVEITSEQLKEATLTTVNPLLPKLCQPN